MEISIKKSFFNSIIQKFPININHAQNLGNDFDIAKSYEMAGFLKKTLHFWERNWSLTLGVDAFFKIFLFFYKTKSH